MKNETIAHDMKNFLLIYVSLYDFNVVICGSSLNSLHIVSVIKPAIKNLTPANNIVDDISPFLIFISLYPILTKGKALPHRKVQILANKTMNFLFLKSFDESI
jgi:hypothetical protein